MDGEVYVAASNLGGVNVRIGFEGPVDMYCMVEYSVVMPIVVGCEIGVGETAARLIGSTGEWSFTDWSSFGADVVAVVSDADGGFDVVAVTTIMDLAFKISAAIWIGHVAGGTVKGVGTSVFGSVITPAASMIDVDTILDSVCDVALVVS